MESTCHLKQRGHFRREALTAQLVAIRLPRFNADTGTSLRTILSGLGMASAFGPDADFSGMTGSPDLSIKDVIHKAFINVGEKGTEAAAATAVIMEDASISDAAALHPLLVDASRPFLYFLYDQPTGAILFMGRVLEPTQN